MKYNLRINVSITQVGEYGEYLSTAGNLQVCEDIQFSAGNFLEVAHTLGQFHEVSERIKAAQ